MLTKLINDFIDELWWDIIEDRICIIALRILQLLTIILDILTFPIQLIYAIIAEIKYYKNKKG